MRLALALTCALLTASAAQAETVEATASARVDASPERVLAVLGDFESWHLVFESVETLGAERRDARHARIRQRVQRAGFTLGYTLAASVDPDAGAVDMVLDPSEPTDMELLATQWRVEPHPDGGSWIHLRVVTRTRLPVPRFLERHIARSTARDSVAELVRALGRTAAAPRSRTGT